MSESARRAALAVFAVALVIATSSRLAPIVRDQLAAPFDLISEGPHLSAIQAVRNGENIYARESYTGPPFHIIPYVPLFHALVALLPADPGNPFFTGRVLSMLFMLAAAASLFVITPTREWLGLPLAACACFFLIHPVTANTAYLRSDPAGLFFSVAAVVLLATRPPTLRRAAAAGACCAIALGCKQSFIAASAACALYLLVRDARLVLAFVAAEAVVLGVLATLATFVWGDGFWYCVALPATRYPRDWPSFVLLWWAMLKQPVFLWMLVMLVTTSMVALARSRRALFRSTPYLPFVLCSFAVQSSALSGIGASPHYFFEPVLAILLWLVWGAVSTGRGRRPDRVTALALVALAACVVREFRFTAPEEYRYTTAALTAEHVRNREEVIAEMDRRGIPHGRLLNFKNSPVTFDYPGEMSVNDPYLFGVMWEVGALSTEPLLDAVRRRYFDAVIVAPGLVSAAGQTTTHPVQRVIRELFDHYQLAIRGHDVNVLTPITRGASAAR